MKGKHLFQSQCICWCPCRCKSGLQCLCGIVWWQCKPVQWLLPLVWLWGGKGDTIVGLPSLLQHNLLVLTNRHLYSCLCMYRQGKSTKCGSVRWEYHVNKMAYIFLKCQPSLPPDIKISHLELLKMANFDKNTRSQVYKVENCPDMSTFSGEGLKNVRCQMWCYKVTDWESFLTFWS